MESVFISRCTINNIAPNLQKCWTHKIAFKMITKMLKQPNFFYSQRSTLPKEALAKFYLSVTFGLSFMISSVAPTRPSASHVYFITKIGNRNLKAGKISNALRFSLTILLKSNYNILQTTQRISTVVKVMVSKVSNFETSAWQRQSIMRSNSGVECKSR